MKRVILCAFLVLPLPAVAHGIIASAYMSSTGVEGEIGMSNGHFVPYLTIKVQTADGAPLGETKTDEDGFFTFVPTQAVDHHFVADLGPGHVATMVVSAADLAAFLGQPVAAPTANPAPATKAVESAQIAQIIQAELRPLRREITELKTHRDLQSILGGLGYIIGVFGVGFYLAARRKMKGRA
jgi:nickel transport protein